MKSSTLLFTFALFFAQFTFAQQISYLDSSQHGVSFRGLSVVNDSVLWVSGSKGTIGKSLDGGQHFSWMKPKGFETRDFRDVEAFDKNTAIIMAVDSPGIILKTKDGGANWKVVYTNNLSGIFLDAMAFKNKLRGVCLGDPINDHFFLIETNDGGDNWTEMPTNQRPAAKKGEACFASSGTNIQFMENTDYEYGFVSGVMDARLFLIGRDKTKADTSINLPIMKGAQTTGANSLVVNGQNLTIIGGDFKNYKRSDSTTTYSSGAGKILTAPHQGPFGYKSCVIWINNKILVSTGLSGNDIMLDKTKIWNHFSDEPFHVVQKAKTGSAVYFAGGNGRIAKLVL